MAKIIAVHSFRGGTGKSNTTANIATLLAIKGLRVGVVDTDIQSPGIHVLFGLGEGKLAHSLNDYLWGKCAIEEAAFDVTPNLSAPDLLAASLPPANSPAAIPGKVYLIPSSTKTGEIARILRESYDVGLLNEGFRDLIERLNLDVLMIDTHPGLNEETLLSIAISNILLIVMRPDQQDYQGTGVTVDIARQLDVPQMLLIVNKMPLVFNEDQVRARVEDTYGCPVGAVLPHSDEMMILASAGIFILRYPDHPMTRKLENVVAKMGF